MIIDETKLLFRIEHTQGADNVRKRFPNLIGESTDDWWDETVSVTAQVRRLDPSSSWRNAHNLIYHAALKLINFASNFPNM